jgi:hypothetical protein
MAYLSGPLRLALEWRLWSTSARPLVPSLGNWHECRADLTDSHQSLLETTLAARAHRMSCTHHVHGFCHEIRSFHAPHGLENGNNPSMRLQTIIISLISFLGNER